jgi:hypothetical protein
VKRSLSGVLTRVNAIATQIARQSQTITNQELEAILTAARRRAFEAPDRERPSREELAARAHRLRRLLRGEPVEIVTCDDNR